MKTNIGTHKRNRWKGVKQIAFAMFVYLLLVVAFYLITGDQLRLRTSRGNYKMGVADSGSIELTAGTNVEQIFVVPIQKLESISVQWGTYYRTNQGTATVSLYDNRTNTLLASESYDASKITECQVTTFVLPTPLEDVYNVPLRLSITADSLSRSALSPMIVSSAKREHFTLSYNGQTANGILCFSATGEDYIWTGLHYWQLSASLGVLLLLYFLYVLDCQKQNKSCFLLMFVRQLRRYSFLMRQLISRDFKSKYKRSVLGILWSFLNPLMTMTVQYIVFSNLFRFDIPNYQVYLLCGIVLFNFFSEACGMMVSSIIGNSALIMKVYIPKYVFPLTRTLSSMINLLISVIPLLAVVLFSGIFPTKAYLLLPFDLLCLMLFTLGVGLILATSMVFFRDTQFLWGVLSMIWMYLTPLFYPESILSDGILRIVKCNPLYYYVNFARTVIIEGVSPEPMMYLQCFLMAFGSLLIGALVFRKNQDHFILYL